MSSSSPVLCDEIVRQAGAQVQQNYDALRSADNFPSTTSGGSLPCKRIFFVPWDPISRSAADVKLALSLFIAIAFAQASNERCKSIG